MIKKTVFEEELISGMQTELHKQASGKTPELTKAADCLHAALEIFESQGLTKQADQVLQVLQKIAQSRKAKPTEQMASVKQLMEAGVTQRDLHEFAKGSPVAKAKLNLVLRQIGMPDHQITKFLGPSNVMSDQDAKEIADPNRSFGKIWEWMQNPNKPTGPSNLIEMESLADCKPDRHTKGLTPEKMVENLKHHGTEFNMADDNLLDIEVNDTLEVSDNEEALSDFEDERD